MFLQKICLLIIGFIEKFIIYQRFYWLHVQHVHCHTITAWNSTIPATLKYSHLTITANCLSPENGLLLDNVNLKSQPPLYSNHFFMVFPKVAGIARVDYTSITICDSLLWVLRAELSALHKHWASSSYVVKYSLSASW